MPNDLAETLRHSSVEIRAHRHGGGSGVIWSRDGLIVTNAHVIGAGGKKASVKLQDGREFPAEVVRHNRERDLAVLKIGAQDLPAAEWGDTSQVQVGQIVAAVGNPLGVVGAVTAGIIHAISDRRWIQADVRLAPGNSGGMLADAEGRVIGINTMIYSGLALAIPGNVASAFANGEELDKPVLGIAMQPAEVHGQPVLVIVEVERGGLAERSGLTIGDVLLMTADKLHAALQAPGSVTLRYLRGNAERQVNVPLPAYAEKRAA